MAASRQAAGRMTALDRPQQKDLDRCVHCGLCLNACPTYRELGIEMDSPRGRIYQMNQVANGAPVTDAYVRHMELCLACRGCESACPSGVQYGRLIEAARADIEDRRPPALPVRWLRLAIFGGLLPSRFGLRLAAVALYLYQRSGMQTLTRRSGVLRLFGKLGRAEQLAPDAELPTFFARYGRVFPAIGERRYRVAFLGGCIANVSFARLNEATVRVLQKNGCEVHVPDGQTCCGALALHAGLRKIARRLARRNVEALTSGSYDAIITNAAGCGSTLKEYHELLDHEPGYVERARRFSSLVKDATEFLASIDLNRDLGAVRAAVTYQDSCHLRHGQKVVQPPRKLLRAIPELTFREMPGSEICCGSAGIYNVVQNEMAMALLERKMAAANQTRAEVIATANPGCLLQLRAGVKLHGKGQRVVHVIELLDEAYRAAR